MAYVVKRDDFYPDRPHPLKMLLWVYLASMVMLFAALTSALLVSKPDNIAKGLWVSIDLPIEFWFSTLIVVLSSITIHFAFINAKKDRYNQTTILLWITTILGISFITTQFLGYKSLNQQNVYFVDNQPNHIKSVQEKVIIRGNEHIVQTKKSNISGSFVFVITGAHLLHVIGAIISVIFALLNAIRLKIHSKNILGLELSVIFWHSLGILWIYLFTFLSITYA